MRAPARAGTAASASGLRSREPAATAATEPPRAAREPALSVAHTPRQQAQQRRIAQLRALAPSPAANGLPASLRAGIESLSGLDMSGVRVHRNSSKPATLQAHAFAQGLDIHLGPGQERHLPHEAWHVVQQAQGRVRATVQRKGGVGINDDAALEREADVMGARASRVPWRASRQALRPLAPGRFTAQRQAHESAVSTKTQTIKYRSTAHPELNIPGTNLIDRVKEHYLNKNYLTRKTNPSRDTYKVNGKAFQKDAAETHKPKVGGAYTEADAKQSHYYQTVTTPQGTAAYLDMKVGVQTLAWLHPSSPIQGTETSGSDNLGGVYKDPDYKDPGTGKSLTACHLLNYDLGGSAVPENLFPHTQHFNKEHSIQREGPAKSQLASLIKDHDDDEDRGLKVEVTVFKDGTPIADGAQFDGPQDFKTCTFRMRCTYTYENAQPAPPPESDGIVHDDRKALTADWNLNKDMSATERQQIHERFRELSRKNANPNTSPPPVTPAVTLPLATPTLTGHPTSSADLAHPVPVPLPTLTLPLTTPSGFDGVMPLTSIHGPGLGGGLLTASDDDVRMEPVGADADLDVSPSRPRIAPKQKFEAFEQRNRNSPTTPAQGSQVKRVKTTDTNLPAGSGAGSPPGGH